VFCHTATLRNRPPRLKQIGSDNARSGHAFAAMLADAGMKSTWCSAAPQPEKRLFVVAVAISAVPMTRLRTGLIFTANAKELDRSFQ
jgi:hypothetical protein